MVEGSGGGGAYSVLNCIIGERAKQARHSQG